MVPHLRNIKKYIDYLLFMSGGSAYRIRIARKRGCVIGENCYLADVSLGPEPYLISIGDHCHIATGVKFITHDGATWVLKNRYGFTGTKFGRIILHDNVYIGNNTIILPNIEIGSNSIVGTGSVVTKSIPPDSVYAGNPAGFICTLDAYLEKTRNDPGNVENSPLADSYRRYEQTRDSSKRGILIQLFNKE
jgi:acetyltransferase-like isoleucine patch superfamily enzyme